MRRIIESSLRVRSLVLIIAVVTLAFGIVQLRSTPPDILPEFAPPIVEVQTEALGLSAAEVEDLVTVPMEELLNGLPWLQTMQSESMPSLSSIVLVFEPGTDIIRARALVGERLTQAHGLPTKNVSKPPAMLQPLSSSSRIMMLGLTSEQLTPIQMSVLSRWTIRPRLMGVPGVANVTVWGNRQRQLQVQVNPEELHARGLTLEQIVSTAGNAMWVSPLSFLSASTPGITGGFVDTPQQRLGVRHIMPISSPEDLAQVAVEGTDLRLGEVAKVVEDHQPLIGDAIVNNGAGLIVVIDKLPGANTLEVTRGVEDALASLKLGLPGLNIDSTIFRPATFIEMAIANLSTSLLIGCVLLLLVLAAFVFQWRRVLIALLTIPLALVAAAFVLHLQGVALNMILLAGLAMALGVVISDIVSSINTIAKRLQQHREAQSDRPASEMIAEATAEVSGPLLFTTLMTLLAVMPIFFMEGPSSTIFQPLAYAFVAAVLMSAVVALLVIPTLSSFILNNGPAEQRVSPVVNWVTGRYNALLGRTIRTPLAGYAILCVLVIVGAAVVPFLGPSLLPSFREPSLLVHWQAAPGTSRPAMNRIVAQASRELRAIPGVINVGAHVGRAVTSDEVVGINSGDLWVSIDPAANYDATVAAVSQAINSYPGFDRNVQTYLQERSRAILTGAEQAVVVRVYGPDLTILRQKAEEVRQALAGISGITNPRVASQDEQPQVEIEVNLAAAEPYGLKPGDVRRAAATLLQGIEVGNLFEEQKVFEVMVVGAPEIRQNMTNIRELLIDTPSGEQVRLGDVANVRIAPSQNMFTREGQSRYIDVGAGVQGRSLGAVAAEVEARLQGIQFPLEYHPELLGEYAAQREAQQRLLGFAIAAAIGIFLLMQAAFNSWRLAFVAFLTLPTALAGGALAALLFEGVLSFGALAGLFALLAIAMRNAVGLIHRYQQLELREGEQFGPELVLRGASEQLVPTLVTALGTGLALLPAAFFASAPGLEILSPMAVVVLGGLVTTLALDLFVLPALYMRFRVVPEGDPVLQPAVSGA